MDIIRMSRDYVHGKIVEPSVMYGAEKQDQGTSIFEVLLNGQSP